MIVNQTAEYALRAMAFLTTLPDGAMARSSDISEAASIPAHYLSKVMRKLVVAGLLESRKGHGGGFTLARDPSEITFLDVLSAAEFDPASSRCAFGYDRCDHEHPCPLHASWQVLNDQFCQWAKHTTLLDVQEFSKLPQVRMPE